MMSNNYPETPWLSVIIPTYNGARYLAATLQSIVGQDHSGVEILLIDDGSTDTTLDIATNMQSQLPITLLKGPARGNWVTSTNQALSRARGEYCTFLHQDDLWMPGRLHVLQQTLSNHPNLEMLFHDVWFIGPAGQRLGRWHCPLPRKDDPLTSDLLIGRLLVQNFIAICTPIFRTATAKKIGGLQEGLWYAADWDFWLRLLQQGPAMYLPSALACFRIHGGSQTITGSRDLDEFERQLQDVFTRHHRNWLAPKAIKTKIHRQAELSILVNTVLAARLHGQSGPLSKLVARLCRIGPIGLASYLRTSRLLERVFARLRVRSQVTPTLDCHKSSVKGQS